MYYLGDKIMADEIDEICGMHRAEGKCLKEFGGGPEGKR
jgi:hypothetical protein